MMGLQAEVTMKTEFGRLLKGGNCWTHGQHSSLQRSHVQTYVERVWGSPFFGARVLLICALELGCQVNVC